MVGKIIDNYKISAILGEGGMGIVYKAFDLRLERFVALKILNEKSLTNPNYIARFKREAKNQAKLNHPNIVPVYGFTEDDGTIGIVMEYVEGETLEHLIKRKGHLELAEALSILKQILLGIGYAHSRGFVHRDIKPSNIIINNEGVVKIMDFGISKSINESTAITKTGVKIGTILYMSPEQVRAQEPTGQSDIYSIGISFYEMLMGKAPFDYESEYEIMEAHLKKNPIKLSTHFSDIPAEVDNIIGRALQKTLERRYKTCGEFLADIENLHDDITLPPVQKKNKKKEKSKAKTVTIARDQQTNKRPLKSKIRFYITAFVVVCLFGGLFYFVYSTVSQFWRVSEAGRGFGSELRPGAAAGFRWRTIASPTVNSLNSIFFVDNSTGYSCGDKGTIVKTTDAGESWVNIGDTAGTNLYDVKFVSSDKGFIVGERGIILSTNDGGKSWQKFTYDTAISLFKIIFLKNNYTGFIVGAHGTILKTNDGGTSWIPVPSSSGQLLYSISFADYNNGVISGWNGTILKTSDQGKTWTEEKKLTDTYLRDICFGNDNMGIIVGGSGEILRSDDGGEEWSKINSDSFSGLRTVFFSHYGTGFILGNKGEIFISNNAGKSWELSNSGSFSALTSITETPSKKIYISAGNGTIISN